MSWSARLFTAVGIAGADRWQERGERFPALAASGSARYECNGAPT
jgi:hypothetical protein